MWLVFVSKSFSRFVMSDSSQVMSVNQDGFIQGRQIKDCICVNSTLLICFPKNQEGVMLLLK